MTTSEYIKFLVIAAGYPKNINVEINRYGLDTMYSVYAETANYKETDDYDIDTCDENSEDILELTDIPSLLDLILEILNHRSNIYNIRTLNHWSIKTILDDNIREDYIKEDIERHDNLMKELELMKPVDELITSMNPCKNAPSCDGDFDDSDTCHNFWKCTHQYYNNCKLLHEFRNYSQQLSNAYRKYIHDKELTDEEVNKLKQHNLI
ncbi:hypothetical protein J6O48_03325 [bacterium]|nr:hypothetical protein [bacterium]